MLKNKILKAKLIESRPLSASIDDTTLKAKLRKKTLSATIQDKKNIKVMMAGGCIIYNDVSIYIDNGYIGYKQGDTFHKIIAISELKVQGESGYTPIKGIDYFDGKDGKPGKDGIGKDGQDGLSAYELWKLEEGNKDKTINDFWAWLRREGEQIVMAGSVNVVPTGGTIGQKLVKKTNQDYDMQWIDDSGGISSIVAGTGIVVDNTDTANPIVSIDNTVVTADSTDTLTNKTLDSYTNFIHADGIHLRVKAKENLVYGDVLMFVGFNAGEQAIEVSKRDDINVPAIGVIHDKLATGEFGMAVSNGLFKNIDTSAFSQGTILYPNTSGGFTDTDPGGYAQQMAYVVRSHHINGEIMLNVGPVYGLGKRDLYTREYLVTNWSEEPALNTAITGGTVYDYVLGSVTRYRFVPTTYKPTQDAFYGAFDGTNLTSLITTRG